jgi:hypothetical protein
MINMGLTPSRNVEQITFDDLKKLLGPTPPRPNIGDEGPTETVERYQRRLLDYYEKLCNRYELIMDVTPEDEFFKVKWNDQSSGGNGYLRCKPDGEKVWYGLGCFMS